ncbi:CpsD/CapB family tyrosine-protein kinase [Listeria booriae]|uniref:CpsD/CapB family tyrosine-protein kinase n=1 Tax=Listeria booriae TaxID=1552123 RepID=UPI0016248713|nr:CpsD/CapB family tyrosine-protein kinase [Listeria booriae]MBC1512347.1 CpsD/CapB family tyrosine-protein kinase [Listeria booriae]MBC1648896.1 CpsD/CapB family tyrosine-protein kinase [Listeria booriae]MBC1943349.1 CpsD/CapB family tyrosine-protein kinase [Listeria booriae]MBC2390695.1 CpsD/CapB family tyrosine-protein kinase [Listeria booriae]MBC6152705.1 CpsD/CapB family tyrosine-protein kinase [Listeria booriae]
MRSKKFRDKTSGKRKLVAKNEPQSAYAESFRYIRANIDFSGIDNEYKSIMITSPDPDSGKSLISANLAITYAALDMKTILIDLDLRKPTVHKIFPECHSSYGITGFLKDILPLEEAIIKTEVPHLDVLPVGMTPADPASILNSEKLQQLYKKLYENYDRIIIDTPPVMSVADAQIIASWVDGSILVIRNNYTKQENAKKALKKLDAAGAKVIGTIFNNTKMKMRDYYYAE